MRYRWFVLFVSIGVLISSCWPDKEEVNVDEIDVSITINRLEQDLFHAHPDSLESLLPQLRARYGYFFDIYSTRVLNIGNPDAPGFSSNLKSFVLDGDMKEVFKETEKQYADFAPMAKELNDGFARYKHYFPNSTIPSIATNISGFNYAIIATDKTLGIGLDMFLGERFVYYQMLGLPQYKIHFMRKESLLSSAMKGWVASEYEFKSKNDNLLSRMIYAGKILYCVDKVFPDLADSLKIDFTSAQMQFVNGNESNIWSHLLEDRKLYTTDPLEIVKYMNEGPFTSGLPREAPARLGEFTGWMIVRKFMENNDVGLQQLMEIEDAQEILTKSKYKPER